jgi:hypothetical protein
MKMYGGCGGTFLCILDCSTTHSEHKTASPCCPGLYKQPWIPTAQEVRWTPELQCTLWKKTEKVCPSWLWSGNISGIPNDTLKNCELCFLNRALWHTYVIRTYILHTFYINPLTLSLLMTYIHGAPTKATNLMSYIYGRDFLLGILLLEPGTSLIYAWKTNKYTNYSFSLLVMYGSVVHTTSLDTTHPSTIFYRLLLNSASIRRH